MEQVAGHRVERAERLVHEQHVGVLRERAGERDALAHAAGQLVRPLLARTSPRLHEVEQLVGPRARARRVGTLRELQRELDVAARGEPREQRRLLEHERWCGRRPSIVPARGLVEAGDQVEQRALAAARRAEEAHELARRDVERDVVERVHRVRRRAPKTFETSSSDDRDARSRPRRGGRRGRLQRVDAVPSRSRLRSRDRRLAALPSAPCSGASGRRCP